MTSPSRDDPDPAGGAPQILDEKDFRYLLAHEANRATRYQHFFSVCLVRPDIDGGEVRRAVAMKIAELLRRTDTVGQIEGETAILLLHTADADAVRVAERIRSTIGHVDFPGAAGRGVRRVTVSMGEACFPDDGLSHGALLSRARAHLDEARRRGGNQVVHGSAP